MKLVSLISFTLFSFLFYSQHTTSEISDSSFIRSIYTTALTEGNAYEDLRFLCKEIGARITGSTEAQMAIEWGKDKMDTYGLETKLHEIQVPHWERGTKEAFYLKSSNGTHIKLRGLALGGSIGTNGTMRAELIEFESLDALKVSDPEFVKGKIVFVNQPMDAKQIQTFKAYGGCYPLRGNSASIAAEKGAAGIIIRSLGLASDPHPHTGSMYYKEGVTKIPAAAICTADADQVHDCINNNLKEKIELIMEMDCRSFPDSKSYNVLGEIKGKAFADEVITVGGHLDSWDTGEGAHDDGAGIIHCLEAFRILKKMNYKPNHTLRLVFFMNEENGNKGGKTYAKWVKENNEKHFAAIESDRGGFAPRGFTCDGSETDIKWLTSLAPIFKDYDLHIFEKGYGGVDIGPLKDSYPNIPLFGFVPDSQRYFDMHHSPNDVFENVNKRELELGAAAIASFIYLLDQKQP
jgi:carboxypeptidase Q